MILPRTDADGFRRRIAGAARPILLAALGVLAAGFVSPALSATSAASLSVQTDAGPTETGAHLRLALDSRIIGKAVRTITKGAKPPKRLAPKASVLPVAPKAPAMKIPTVPRPNAVPGVTALPSPGTLPSSRALPSTSALPSPGALPAPGAAPKTVNLPRPALPPPGAAPASRSLAAAPAGSGIEGADIGVAGGTGRRHPVSTATAGQAARGDYRRAGWQRGARGHAVSGDRCADAPRVYRGRNDGVAGRLRNDGCRRGVDPVGARRLTRKGPDPCERSCSRRR